MLEVMVPVHSLAAPLPSVPAVPGGPWDLAGSWSGTGGEEEVQAELGKDPEAAEKPCWEERAPSPRGKARLCGDIGHPPLTAWFRRGTLLLPALLAPSYQITLAAVFQARAAHALPVAITLQRPAEGTRQWQLSPRNQRCLPVLGCVLGGPGGKETISIRSLIPALFYRRGECYTWGRGTRHGMGGVCQSPSPSPKPWAEPGWKLLPPAENAGDWGDTHGFPWRAWGTPRAVGSRVTLGKNNPRKGDLGVGRQQVLPQPGWRGVTKHQRPRLSQQELGHPPAVSWEGTDGTGGPGCSHRVCHPSIPTVGPRSPTLRGHPCLPQEPRSAEKQMLA